MALKALVICIIITLTPQVQVYARSIVFPGQSKISPEDAHDILEKVKSVLEENVALGNANLDKLRVDLEQVGNKIIKDAEEDRQKIHDDILDYIQSNVDTANILGVDVTECNVDQRAEFDEIMDSVLQSVRNHFENYIIDCEIDIQTGKNRIIGVNSEVEELERKLAQCTDDTCLREVYKKGNELISSIPRRVYIIGAETFVKITKNQSDLRGFLYNIMHSVSDEMHAISKRVVDCITEKINYK